MAVPTAGGADESRLAQAFYVAGYLFLGNRGRIDGREAPAEQVEGLRGIGEGKGDGGVKAAERCVVKHGSVVSHRDDEAVRLGVIEDSIRHP